MQISIPIDSLKSFLKVTGCKSSLLEAKADRSWHGVAEIPLDKLTAPDLALLHQWLRDNHKTVSKLSGIYRKADTYIKLVSNPTKSDVTSLEGLVAALKSYIAPSKHHWLFSETRDGALVPYYVLRIGYKPREGEHAAYVHMEMRAYERGSNTACGLIWHAADIGKTKGNVVQLLQSQGYFLETDDAVERYQAELEIYDKLHVQLGEQFTATGSAKSGSHRWYSDLIPMERDGRTTKVVMDDEVGDDESDEEGHSRRGSSRESGISSTSFWDEAGKDGDEEAGNGSVALPIHPYVRVFDLEKHTHVTIHVSNLAPYEYDETLFDKLVLPDDTKDLVSILMQSATDQLDDIVAGKTGGTIIIATGPPGTGKTLTAEVFSEAIKRPLYVVQCSQLGTDEETLEKHLNMVLARATRWKAILLIDEADVYVHERGKSIQQNAIVGVFLRVLEYYRGILFMTSNRSTIIDDAIMSRATAWLRYNNPTVDERMRIWDILSKQFDVELDGSTLTELRTQKLGNVSGRNIKNLLKLAKRLSTAKSIPVTFKLLQNASRFLGVESKPGAK